MRRLAGFVAPLTFLLYPAGILFNYAAVAIVCLSALIVGVFEKGDADKSGVEKRGFLLQLRGIAFGIYQNFWLSTGLIVLLSSWTVSAIITPDAVDALLQIADILMVFSFSMLLLAALRSLSLDGLQYQFMASALVVLGFVIIFLPPFASRVDSFYVCTNQVAALRLALEAVGLSEKPSMIDGYAFLIDDLRTLTYVGFSFERLLKIGYCSILILPFVAQFVASRRHMRLLDWLLVLAVLGAVMTVALITQRRTALLGILCMGVAFLWQQRYLLYSYSWWRSYLLRFWVLFGVLVFAVGLAVALLLGFVERLDFASGQVGVFAPTWLIDLARQSIWHFSFEQLPKVGLFGFGIDQSNLIPGASLQSPHISFPHPNIFSTPHNIVLELLIDTGWLGTLAFLFCAAVLVWPSLKARQDPELLLHVGFFASYMVNFSLWGHAWWWACYLFAVAIMRYLKSQTAS